MYHALTFLLCKFVEIFAGLSYIAIVGTLIVVPLLVQMITKSWKAWSYTVAGIILMFFWLRYYFG